MHNRLCTFLSSLPHDEYVAQCLMLHLYNLLISRLRLSTSLDLPTLNNFGYAPLWNTYKWHAYSFFCTLIPLVHSVSSTSAESSVISLPSASSVNTCPQPCVMYASCFHRVGFGNHIQERRTLARCNMRATCVQHVCNMRATYSQYACKLRNLS